MQRPTIVWKDAMLCGGGIPIAESFVPS